jgi:hypothetical protein
LSGLPLEFSEMFGEALKRVRKSRTRRQLDLAVDVSVDHSRISRAHPNAAGQVNLANAVVTQLGTI